jgi:uncharacterized protein YecE (DUF72 family)
LLSVVRLHGRNHGTWNRKGSKAPSQRFDYDYNDGELREIGGQVQKIARKVETTHALFNNNYEDQGQRGARTLSALLTARN